MHKLVALALALGVGAAAPVFADCPVANRTTYKLSVFVGPRDARRQIEVAAGAAIAVPDGEFGVVLGQGAHGGNCRAGVKFEVIRDASVTWAVTPRVVESPR